MSHNAALLALLCCVLVCLCRGQNTRTKITNLPGIKNVPFDQYSGYVTVYNKTKSSARNLFYWFAESQKNPSTDPIILWFTGGPGCSSLFGMFTENGPFEVQANGVDLSLRDTSWNKLANVIWVESPCGVGFSYSNDGNYTTGDNQTADDAFHFVLGFFELFPEFKGHDFFVSGESYGGHYVPQLSNLLFERESQVPVNFIGFSAGNPSTDNPLDFNGYVNFLYGHALISDEFFFTIFEKCGQGKYYENQYEPQCADLLFDMYSIIGRINPYDIYEPCIGYYSAHGGCFTQGVMAQIAGIAAKKRSQTVIPCINVTATAVYLNNPAVQAAIHVSSESRKHWEVCSSILNYVYSAESVLPIYQKLWRQKRILVYSGDVDSCVPFVGTQNSIDSLQLSLTEDWRPWILDGQVAGYVKVFEGKTGITYATVKDSGHMVPMYKPKAAFEMIRAFLNGEALPYQ